MVYYLFSPRSGGWLTKSSTYSSSLSDARAFDRDMALAMVKRQRDQAGYSVLPVRAEDLV